MKVYNCRVGLNDGINLMDGGGDVLCEIVASREDDVIIVHSLDTVAYVCTIPIGGILDQVGDLRCTGIPCCSEQWGGTGHIWEYEITCNAF